MVINYHQYNTDGNGFSFYLFEDGVQDGCRRIVRFRIACELVNLAHFLL